MCCAEKAVRSEDPMELPLLVAKAKATAVIEKLKQIDTSIVPSIVITMDQVVLFKDTIREKPESETEAVQFLSSYSDQMVSTISGVVVTHFPSMVQRSGVDVAKVYWKTISPQIVRKVVNKNEIYKSAGGFKIEDDDLNPLIRRIEGTESSNCCCFPYRTITRLRCSLHLYYFEVSFTA